MGKKIVKKKSLKINKVIKSPEKKQLQKKMKKIMRFTEKKPQQKYAEDITDVIVIEDKKRRDDFDSKDDVELDLDEEEADFEADDYD